MVRLYLDTALRREAEELFATGAFYGLTTNPLLLKQAGLKTHDLPELYDWATRLGAREVFFQASGGSVSQLIGRARRLSKIGEHVVVKIPFSAEGCAVAARLVSEGRRVLLTAIAAPHQAVVAAALGVDYVAPYLGRLNDAGRPGHDEIVAMARALRGTGSKTRLLVASVRSPGDIVALARHGITAFTLAPGVARQLFEDPLTESWVRSFEEISAEVEG